MDKNKKIPEVRFKGFEDEWTSIRLCDISQKVTEKNTASVCQNVFTNSAEYGIINQRDFFDHDVANADNIQGYYVVRPNDYVYNPRISTTAPVGPINRNKLGYNGVMSPLYYVFRVEPQQESILYFLDYYFKSNKWHDFMFKNGNSGARSDRFSISDSTFSLMPILYPKKEEEQMKIGKMLTVIDTLIRKLEQKLEKLRNIKQSLLNQMFINVNRGGYTPLIRFKGFEDEWSVVALNDISERITRKNTNNESSLPLTISAQYGLINQNVFFNSRIASKDVSGYYLIKKGEFAYNKSTSDGYPVGAVKRLNKYEMGVLSTLYIIFALKKEKLNSDFLSAFFETGKWHEHIYQCASEGARNHGLLNISSDDFLKLKILAPKAKNEQALISEFVMLMDRLVNESTDKLSKFRSMKHSLLQKMFV